MNPELEEYLFNNFPFMKSINCVTFERTGYPVTCECNSGWFELIKDMCIEIQDYCNNNNVNTSSFCITQIKEKYGTLRVYTTEVNYHIDNIINKYVELSRNKCEICGKDGSMAEKSKWLKVLCDDCMTKYDFSRMNVK